MLKKFIKILTQLLVVTAVNRTIFDGIIVPFRLEHFIKTFVYSTNHSSVNLICFIVIIFLCTVLDD